MKNIFKNLILLTLFLVLVLASGQKVLARSVVENLAVTSTVDNYLQLNFINNRWVAESNSSKMALNNQNNSYIFVVKY